MDLAQTMLSAAAPMLLQQTQHEQAVEHSAALTEMQVRKLLFQDRPLSTYVCTVSNASCRLLHPVVPHAFCMLSSSLVIRILWLS